MAALQEAGVPKNPVVFFLGHYLAADRPVMEDVFMSIDQNKQVVREFLEKVWNNGEYDLIPSFLDPRYRAYALRTGYIVKGIEGVLDNVQGVHRTYANFRISVQDMFGETDKVVTRLTLHATRETKAITMREIIIHRLENSKIMEAWSIGSGWN